MKTPFAVRSILFAALLVAAAMLTSSAARAAHVAPGYHHAVRYQGPYIPDAVYYRISEDAQWTRGLAGRFPQAVSCPDALLQLKASGFWRGHFKKDGSCGTPFEPSFWALGNRINYDISNAPAAPAQ